MSCTVFNYNVFVFDVFTSHLCGRPCEQISVYALHLLRETRKVLTGMVNRLERESVTG